MSHELPDARTRASGRRYTQPYTDGSMPLDYGLIAEEVAEVYPDLVARDESGEIETVQYHKLTPMLLNELQQMRREVDAQREEIQAQHSLIRALETRLRLVESGRR